MFYGHSLTQKNFGYIIGGNFFDGKITCQLYPGLTISGQASNLSGLQLQQ
jgi:hypothetical protein